MQNLLGRLSLMSVVALGLAMGAAMNPTSVHEFTMKAIDGKAVPLSQFKGQVMLMVNVASRCGFTPQYEGLEKLYETYKAQGFVIAGFPANNFGAQEPGTDAEIQTFCKSKYSVTFPMFSKISVAGTDKAPLYRFLTDTSGHSATGGEIQWNFTKFLVDREGKVIQRFEPSVEPMSREVTSAVEAAVKRK
jgi:glutathione peroxidase